MPTFTATKNYTSGTVLTKAQLDAMIDGVATFLNTTKIDQDNIATGGVATASLADVSVTAAKLASDAVTSAKILNGAVTSAKLDTNIAVSGTLGVTGATTLSSTVATGALTVTGALSTTGNVTVGDGASDVLRIGGGSGPTLTSITTANKSGIASSGANDGLFYPNTSSYAALKASNNVKALYVYNPTADNAYPIVISADPGSNGLVIVRGTVTSAGAISVGEGYTSVKTGTGQYTVTFSNNFAGTPSCTANVTGLSATGWTVVTHTVGVGAFSLVIRDKDDVLGDQAFAFTAIGTR